MKFFNSKSRVKREFLDGYVEGPLAHGKYATSTDKENEYFFQWTHPIKLQRIALKSPLGFAITHGYSEDVWNNDIGIRIQDEAKVSKVISHTLVSYLKSRLWFHEMEKFTGFIREQGKSALHLLFEKDDSPDDFVKPVDSNEEIIEVQAIHPLDYSVYERDDDGNPLMYRVKIKSRDRYSGAMTVDVHASRIMEFVNKDIRERGKPYSILEVCYDSLVILTNISKGAGEAAYRWGTGHPLILTKDLTDSTMVEDLRTLIGDPTRRSWHYLPSEYIDTFTMIGQAGQMLNLKSLADILIDQIVAATGIPRPILLGEVAGVVTGSEVNERSYFAALDKTHTDLEPFVRAYFERDVNVRKLLAKYPEYELDWGMREVLSKQDQVEYEQKEISNALALTSIITINEARERLGYPPLEDDLGNIILGLESFYAPEQQQVKQQAAGTERQAQSNQNDLEKNKRLKDALCDLRSGKSMKEIADELNVSIQTLYKIYESLELV